MRYLISLSKFVSFLNSMTATELIDVFPGRFHLPLAVDSIESTTTKMLTNDDILWKMVKGYNQFLLKDLTLGMFEGEDKVFIGGRYIDRQSSVRWNTYEIKGLVIFRDGRGVVNASIGKKVVDLCDCDIEFSKPIFKSIGI